MTPSRRQLLAAVPAAAALAVSMGVRWNEGAVVDVRNFGARGDGASDDSPAIQAAAAALGSGGTLRFPRGTYRFARRWPAGGAAIVVNGVSDVTVEFAPGAELFMDNLDPNARTGTSHGLLVRGPSSRISLRNVNVRWAAGSRRSLGDGIRVLGCPTLDGARPAGWTGSRTPVEGIVATNCVIRGSPQTGMVLHGVSAITVDGLQVIDSAADGLHFNACRRARINGLHAQNTGDDGLALVTYFKPHFTFDRAAHTFAFDTLTDWSNADFAVKDVTVTGGAANGLRIAGAQRVTVDGLRVTGVRSGSAVMVDSAEPGTDVGWNYLASRSIRVDDVVATRCDTGIHLLARPSGSADPRFTEFDVSVGHAQLDGCDNWSVRAESLTDHGAGGVSGLRLDGCSITSTSTTGGNGGVGIEQARVISLGDIMIRQSSPVVAFHVVDADHLTVDRLTVDISADQPSPAAVKPAVEIERSSGVIGDLDIRWPAAPSSWQPVLRAGAGRCGGPSVDIRSLEVVPPLDDSTATCS